MLVEAEICRISLVRRLTWSTLRLSSIASFNTVKMFETFALMISMFVWADCSISFARAFIAMEYLVIAPHSSAVSLTSRLMSAALLLMMEALLATFWMAADNAPVKEERSFVLLLEVFARFNTSLTTLLIRSELP